MAEFDPWGSVALPPAFRAPPLPKPPVTEKVKKPADMPAGKPPPPRERGDVAADRLTQEAAAPQLAAAPATDANRNEILSNTTTANTDLLAIQSSIKKNRVFNNQQSSSSKAAVGDDDDEYKPGDARQSKLPDDRMIETYSQRFGEKKPSQQQVDNDNLPVPAPLPIEVVVDTKNGTPEDDCATPASARPKPIQEEVERLRVPRSHLKKMLKNQQNYIAAKAQMGGDGEEASISPEIANSGKRGKRNSKKEASGGGSTTKEAVGKDSGTCPNPAGTVKDNLYVQYLPMDATVAEVKALFEEVGPVRSCVIMMDLEKNRSKGYGFVLMEKEDDAKAAIEKFHTFPWRNKKLLVRLADKSPTEAAALNPALTAGPSKKTKTETAAVKEVKKQHDDLHPAIAAAAVSSKTAATTTTAAEKLALPFVSSPPIATALAVNSDPNWQHDTTTAATHQKQSGGGLLGNHKSLEEEREEGESIAWRKIYVKGLPVHWRDFDVIQYFSGKFGPVDKVQLFYANEQGDGRPLIPGKISISSDGTAGAATDVGGDEDDPFKFADFKGIAIIVFMEPSSALSAVQSTGHSISSAWTHPLIIRYASDGGNNNSGAGTGGSTLAIFASSNQGLASSTTANGAGLERGRNAQAKSVGGRRNEGEEEPSSSIKKRQNSGNKTSSQKDKSSDQQPATQRGPRRNNSGSGSPHPRYDSSQRQKQQQQQQQQPYPQQPYNSNVVVGGKNQNNSGTTYPPQQQYNQHRNSNPQNAGGGAGYYNPGPAAGLPPMAPGATLVVTHGDAAGSVQQRSAGQQRRTYHHGGGGGRGGSGSGAPGAVVGDNNGSSGGSAPPPAGHHYPAQQEYYGPADGHDEAWSYNNQVGGYEDQHQNGGSFNQQQLHLSSPSGAGGDPYPLPQQYGYEGGQQHQQQQLSHPSQTGGGNIYNGVYNVAGDAGVEESYNTNQEMYYNRLAQPMGESSGGGVGGGTNSSSSAPSISGSSSTPNHHPQHHQHNTGVAQQRHAPSESGRSVATAGTGGGGGGIAPYFKNLVKTHDPYGQFRQTTASSTTSGPAPSSSTAGSHSAYLHHSQNAEVSWDETPSFHDQTTAPYSAGVAAGRSSMLGSPNSSFAGGATTTASLGMDQQQQASRSETPQSVQAQPQQRQMRGVMGMLRRNFRRGPGDDVEVNVVPRTRNSAGTTSSVARQFSNDALGYHQPQAQLSPSSTDPQLLSSYNNNNSAATGATQQDQHSCTYCESGTSVIVGSVPYELQRCQDVVYQVLGGFGSIGNVECLGNGQAIVTFTCHHDALNAVQCLANTAYAATLYDCHRAQQW